MTHLGATESNDQQQVTEGFQFNLGQQQASLLSQKGMVLCISRTRDFWPKSLAKRCGLYTSLYGSHHPTIKFTAEVSDTETTFLDTKVYEGDLQKMLD